MKSTSSTTESNVSIRVLVTKLGKRCSFDLIHNATIKRKNCVFYGVTWLDNCCSGYLLSTKKEIKFTWHYLVTMSNFCFLLTSVLYKHLLYVLISFYDNKLFLLLLISVNKSLGGGHSETCILVIIFRSIGGNFQYSRLQL